MYNYVAGATGLDAAMPPAIQEGGFQAWAERLKDPATRRQVALDMNTDTDEWENFYFAVGSPDNILLIEFKNEALKPYTGKTLAEVVHVAGDADAPRPARRTT